MRVGFNSLVNNDRAPTQKASYLTTINASLVLEIMKQSLDRQGMRPNVYASNV